ncbi:hypothetical protein [uncultured Reyranella sp.]|uniref:hypothetical protein n=1 Tax=uncultured Reyranella sp. TaxID=735512 RepID=UPI0025D8F556|nr:hypothetical protein [uncultured Reyranella sp.]
MNGLSLPTFTEAHLPDGADRLKVLKNWLTENGITGSHLKDTADSIKNQIFEVLTFKDIEPTYMKLLEGMPTQSGQDEGHSP